MLYYIRFVTMHWAIYKTKSNSFLSAGTKYNMQENSNIYFMFGIILNDPLRLFILSKTYRGHLLITEHTSCSKSNLFFLFVFVQKLKQIHRVSKGSTSNVSGRNWANQQPPRKVIWQCYCIQVDEKKNASELTNEHNALEKTCKFV